MRPSTEIERAYFAGFFDGEGCVRLRPKINSLVVHVTQVDPRPLILGQKIWGGYVKPRKKVEALHQQQWRWELYSLGDQKRFLSEVRSFLQVKGEQVDEALRWLGAGRVRRRLLADGIGSRLRVLKIVSGEPVDEEEEELPQLRLML